MRDACSCYVSENAYKDKAEAVVGYHAVIFMQFSRDLSKDRLGMFLRYSFAK